MPASLRFAAGNLWCSAQPGSRANSPAAQTSTSPDPSGLPLLGAFTRVLGSGLKPEFVHPEVSKLGLESGSEIFVEVSAKFSYMRVGD